MTKEYRDIKPGEESVRTVLQKGHARNKHAQNLELYHLSTGFEPAGSVARLQEKEIWGVRYYFDGAFHGKRFLSRTEAEEYFARLSA